MSNYNFSNTDLLQIYEILLSALISPDAQPIVLNTIVCPYSLKFDTIANHEIFSSVQGVTLKSLKFSNTGNGSLNLRYKLNGNDFYVVEVEHSKTVSASCIEGGTLFNSMFPFNGSLTSQVGDGSNILTLECEIKNSNEAFTVEGEILVAIPYPS